MAKDNAAPGGARIDGGPVLRYEKPSLDLGVRPILAIGTFDGVHLGHQAILREAVLWARRIGGTAVAFTFDRHPLELLAPERRPGLLCTLEEKVELLLESGVDRCLIARFDQAFAGQGARQFVEEVLAGRLGAFGVVVGFDFSFGRGREGDPGLLRRLGESCGLEVRVMEPVLLEGARVSSSAVRRALAAGDVATAARMLGRPYRLEGIVVRGEGRGRGLGFPTANVQVPQGRLLPVDGVYTAWAQLRPDRGEPGDGERDREAADPAGDRRVPALAVVSSKPTFGGERPRQLEVHLLDWRGDLYGRRVRVAFEHRLRAVMAFPSVEALVRQMRADVTAARERLGRMSK